MSYKGYIIKAHAAFPSLHVVVTEGQGGSVPNDLSGFFTRDVLAKEAIDKYVDGKKENTRVRKTNSKD